MLTPKQIAFTLVTAISVSSRRCAMGEIETSLEKWFPHGTPSEAETRGLLRGALIVGKRLRLNSTRGAISEHPISARDLSAAFVRYFEDDNASISPFCPWIILALGGEVPALSDRPAAELRKAA